tara:strand:- start:472 stop:885 length:414 start_codon:yes stop_codon:yes gene_type:complete
MLFDISSSHDIFDSEKIYSGLPYTKDTKDFIKMYLLSAYNIAKSSSKNFVFPVSVGKTLTIYCIDKYGSVIERDYEIPIEPLIRDIHIMLTVEVFLNEYELNDENTVCSGKASELLCSSVLKEDEIFEYIFGKPMQE